MKFQMALLEQHLRDVVRAVEELVSQRKGGEVLGAVPGRSEAEDVSIGVDIVCQRLLEDWCLQNGLDAEIHSEHGTSRPLGRSGPPQYLIASDPFDGSGLFRRGLSAEWWSVVTIYEADSLIPLAGGAVDILRHELYLAQQGSVSLMNLDTNRQSRLAPPRKLSLDETTVIAVYMMDPSYLRDWVAKGKGLLETLTGRLSAVRFWPNGGSCIYPWLARGLVHAYVMFDEPRSEIDPGLAFASAAGYPVFSVGPDGTLEPYSFVPGTQADRVPFFVASCTTELAEDIVQSILLT